MRIQYTTIVTMLTLFGITSGQEYLVRIDEPVNLSDFHCIEQTDNRSLVIATDEEMDAIRKTYALYTILDENPRGNIYYLVYPIRETRAHIENRGKIITEFPSCFLVSVSPEREQDLLTLDAEFNSLEFDKMVFSERPPQELLTARITGNPEIQKLVDAVSTDTLVSVIRHLQSIPSRHVNYPFNADKAIPWICGKLKAYGCDSVYTQPVPGYNAPNAVGVKLGRKYPSYRKYFVIGAHPDCMPAGNPNHGADDNATGIAAFLEAARIFRNYSFDYTVAFIAFNAEEVGMKGSVQYAKTAKDHRGDTILSVLNIERCGHVHKVAKILLTYKRSMPDTKILADLFMSAAKTYTGLACDYNPQELTNSDHASFWNKGYTAIMAKEEHQPEAYHTVNDTVGNPKGLNDLDFHTRVVKTAIATLAELAKLSPTGTAPSDHGLDNARPFITCTKVSTDRFAIRTSLKADQIRSIALYSVDGRLVRRFPQTSKFFWNRTDHLGNPVSAGVYVLIMQSVKGVFIRSYIFGS